MDDSRAASLVFPAYLFSFFSGVAALAYQIVWTKQLSLAFGGTTLAASATVAAFMAGMSVGAWLCHKLVARVGSAMRLYAIAELTIGIAALAVTIVLLPGLPDWLATLPEALRSGDGLVGMRFIAAFALLLLPTAAMGATFPALSTALVHSRATLGKHLGMVYGLNTLGAALGAAISGFVLVEWLGLRGTVMAAALVNFGIGVAAIAVLRREGRGADEHATPEAPLESALPMRVTSVVLVVSGFATLCYEILWFRSLTYLFGSSTYAFTVTLVVFLIGLGAGPLLTNRIARSGRLDVALAATQFAVAACAIVAIGIVAAFIDSSGLEAQVSVFAAEVHARAWPWRLAAQCGVACIALMPPAFFMGLSFPLASALHVRNVERLGPRLGAAVVLANIGSILGALLAALVVLPTLGTIGGTRCIALLNFGLGLFVLFHLKIEARRRMGVLVVFAALMAVLLTVLPSRLRFTVAGREVAQSELLFQEEGDLATVQVWRDMSQPRNMGMAIDGTTIGATPGWNAVVYTKQVLIAHLPFVLEPELSNALAVGLGSGGTLAELVAYDELSRIDVVEINEPVVRGARLFEGMPAIFEDPRVHVIVDDAIHFLLREGRSYDLIASDGKQAMSFAGNAKLMSQEYYEAAERRLTERGLFVQWVPLSVGEREAEIILRTLLEAFPQVEVFFEAPSHMLFVGSRTPLRDRTHMTPAAFEEGPTGARLGRLRIGDVEALLARWVAGRAELEDALGPGPTNTWDRSPLEFSAYRQSLHSWERGAEATLARLVEAHRTADTPLAGDPVRAQAMQALRESLLAELQGDRERSAAHAARARELAPLDPAIRYWSGKYG